MTEPPIPLTPDAASRLRDIDVVLFDLDGTIIDTLGLILTSFRHTTEVVLGSALPDQVLMRNVGVPLAQQMREFSEEHAEELVRVYREHNARVHDDLVREYPGTEDALDALAEQGFRLGIVTSKSRPVAERGLACFGLGERFETLVAMEDTVAHKPDPAPVLLAAQRMGVSAARCAYVGDSPYDVGAANAAGALAIAAGWGVSDAETLLAARPACLLSTIAELVPLLATARTHSG